MTQGHVVASQSVAELMPILFGASVAIAVVLMIALVWIWRKR
jgi:hypothetical protein